MASPCCAAHPDRPAQYVCESCDRLLCDACVEVGHRLLFCRHCRERALPIELPSPGAARQAAPDAPLGATAGSPERFARVNQSTPGLFVESLRVVRGYGGATILLATAALTLGELAPVLFGWLALATAVLLPGYLLEVARAAREGAPRLPPWPDITDVSLWGRDFGPGLAALAVAAVPWILARRAAGCDVESFLIEDRAVCTVASTAGAAAGVTLLGLALGAVASWASGWLAVRLDLHLEAAVTATRGAAAGVGLLFGAPAGVALASTDFGSISPAELALRNATVLAALLAAAWTGGCQFARYRDRLTATYGPPSPPP